MTEDEKYCFSLMTLMLPRFQVVGNKTGDAEKPFSPF